MLEVSFGMLVLIIAATVIYGVFLCLRGIVNCVSLIGHLTPKSLQEHLIPIALGYTALSSGILLILILHTIGSLCLGNL